MNTAVPTQSHIPMFISVFSAHIYNRYRF